MFFFLFRSVELGQVHRKGTSRKSILRKETVFFLVKQVHENDERLAGATTGDEVTCKSGTLGFLVTGAKVRDNDAHRSVQK